MYMTLYTVILITFILSENETYKTFNILNNRTQDSIHGVQTDVLSLTVLLNVLQNTVIDVLGADYPA